MDTTKRFLAILLATMISVLMAGTAQAEVPAGQFAVISDTPTGTTLEFGRNVPFSAIKARVGDQFKEYYGRELDDASLQAAFPDKVIPACIKTDGGHYTSKYYGVNNVRPWLEDCKTSGVKLAWLIVGSGGAITFPKVPKPVVSATGATTVAPPPPKLLTYEEKEALRDQKCSCYDNAECLKKRITQLGETVPTATATAATPVAATSSSDTALKTANDKVADLEKQLAQAKSAPAPATIAAAPVTESRQRSPWPPALFAIAMCLGGFIIYYGRKVKPMQNHVARLIKERIVDNTEFDELKAKSAAAINAKTEFEGLANEFGLLSKGGPFRSMPELSHREMATKIRQAHAGLVAESERLQSELNGAKKQLGEANQQLQAATKRAQDAEEAGRKWSAYGEQRKLESESRAKRVMELEQQAIAMSNDAAQAASLRMKIQEEDVLRKRFAALVEEAKPKQKELRRAHAALLQAQMKRPLYERLLMTYRQLFATVQRMGGATGDTQGMAEIETVIEKNEKDIIDLGEQRKQVMSDLDAIIKEANEIHLRLTGSPDADALVLLEANAMHRDAEEVLAIAKSKEAKIEQALNDASRILEAQNAQRAEFENRVNAFQAAEAGLGERERKLAEDRATLERYENDLRGEVAAKLEEVNVLKSAWDHLVGEALESSGLERSLPIEEIVKMGGAPGLIGDAIKAKLAAEEAAASARAVSEELKAQLTRQQDHVTELERENASLRAEHEAYASIAEMRSESSIPVISGDNDSHPEDRFERTGDWERTRGDVSMAPITSPMGIPMAPLVPDRSSLYDDDGDEETILTRPVEEVRAEQKGHTETLKGNPQTILKTALSSRPQTPTNGAAQRKTTLDGITPPTAGAVQGKFNDLAALLAAINGHLNTVMDKPIIGRKLAEQLDDFLRRPCVFDKDLLDSSPHSAEIIMRHDDMRDRLNKVTFGSVPETARKLGIVFPKRTLMPPSAPPL